MQTPPAAVTRALVLLLAMLMLNAAGVAAAGAAAQGASAEPTCKRIAPRPDKRKPQEIRDDSLVEQVRREIREVVRERARVAGVAEPSGLVYFPAHDSQLGEQVAYHRTNLPDSLKPVLLAAVEPLLQRLPKKSKRAAHVRLDVQPGIDTLDTSKLECMPRLLNPYAAQRALESRYPQLMIAQKRPATIKARMLITRDGEVAFAEITRFSSYFELNRVVLPFIRELEFAPVRHGDYGLDVWAEMPISFHPAGYTSNRGWRE